MRQRSLKIKTDKPVLDACCGSRMFWFDRNDPRALFVDKRRETCQADSRRGRRAVEINPDLVADFTNLPFKDDVFNLVVFDPPHLTRNGRDSWMAKKYGTLGLNWRLELRRGFSECLRVLRPAGTLVFKWNETDISVAEILDLCPVRPLFGSKYGKHYRSHWIVFIKPTS